MNKDDIKKELTKYIYDPNLIMVKSLDYIDKGLNGKLDIPDPSNPFIFLMENTATISSALAQEYASNMRNMYPYLATDKKSLYHHLTNDELNNIFAVPSKAGFSFMINKKDILNFGYRTGNYTEIIIPKFSTITINDLTYTLLNDILVKVYNNGKTFAKFMYNTLDISYKSGEMIDSTTLTDNNGMEWILLDIELQQIKRYVYNETIIKGSPIVMEFKLNNNEKYTFLTADSMDLKTGLPIELKKTYSEFVYNPDVPYILIKPLDNNIVLEVPSVFVFKDMIESFVNVELYTTLGNIVEPLYSYNSTDFVFHIEMPNTTDPRITGIKNINFVVSANTYTYGGMDEITFQELKNKVITKSTGDNKLPITIYEIKDKITNYGFSYAATFNTLLEREILVNKNIGNLNYDVFTTIDEFYNEVHLYKPNINSKKIKFRDNYTIIEPFQFYKYKNGTIRPLNSNEESELANMALSKIDEYNKNKYFFNLYKYILDKENGLYLRVYDVNQPTIDNVKTTYINDNSTSTVTILDRSMKYKIEEDSDNYIATIEIEPESWITEIGSNYLFGELVYHTKNGGKFIIKGNSTITNDKVYFTFNLKTNGYIDKNDTLMLVNGIGDLAEMGVNITTNFSMTIYTTKNDLPNGIEAGDLTLVYNETPTAVFYQEFFDINFGIVLENLFTNYRLSYTRRKFKVYEEDVYLTYKENVYELDKDGTIKIVPKDTDNDGQDDDVELVIAHHAGEIVKDSNGNPVILHHKGDVMLDDNGKPIIDNEFGVIHIPTLLLIEDNFLRVTNKTYKDYRIAYFKELTNVITDELKTINQYLLDNTRIKFIPSNNLNKVVVNINYLNVAFDNFVSPTVIIYVDKEIPFVLTSAMERKVALIVQEELSKPVTIASIEKKIEESIGPDVLSVRISNIFPNNETNILNYVEYSSKFIVNKRLVRQPNGELVVKPDISITVVKI